MLFLLKLLLLLILGANIKKELALSLIQTGLEMDWEEVGNVTTKPVYMLQKSFAGVSSSSSHRRNYWNLGRWIIFWCVCDLSILSEARKKCLRTIFFLMICR